MAPSNSLRSPCPPTRVTPRSWSGARRGPSTPSSDVTTSSRCGGPTSGDIRDELGIWTGRRQFQARLRPDANGAGGFSHPPAYFTLQGNKAYLFYSGQPPFCRQCHSFGHTLEGCANLRCRNCLESGHMARDCKGPRRCKQCNGEDHLARSCPQKKTTYADALSGNRAVGTENGGGALAPTTGQEQPATGAGGEALVEVEEAPSSATPMQEGSPNKVEQLALAPGVSSRRKKSGASPRGRKKSRREAQPNASSPPAATSPAVAAGDQGRQCPPSPMLEALPFLMYPLCCCWLILSVSSL
ncbi:uncharacterized protein LOC125721943 isoform X3 [Brienomyrus brachyistius]|uniref:uncharacterized protein LOC125721943 isoform X3 n=1 Tax=Brienomyrus brachyistius TaxID=42636 RepID=UPI0020B348E1|nr:uncharacterized protein LOC125721943 isoform X3 [Brienomyrus brachyistius]